MKFEIRPRPTTVNAVGGKDLSYRGVAGIQAWQLVFSQKVTKARQRSIAYCLPPRGLPRLTPKTEVRWRVWVPRHKITPLDGCQVRRRKTPTSNHVSAVKSISCSLPYYSAVSANRCNSVYQPIVTPPLTAGSIGCCNLKAHKLRCT